jgi:hypothetical protein
MSGIPLMNIFLKVVEEVHEMSEEPIKETSSNTKEQSGYFQFSQDAKVFINSIKNNSSTGDFGVMLNFYMLCANLGLAAYDKDESLPEPPKPGNEVTDEFTGYTRNSQILNRSFLMYQYLNNLGYTKEDLDEDGAEVIENSMDAFLQSSGSKLTNKGMKLLDSFAQKGWDIIKEANYHHINDFALFLCKYVDLLSTYTEKE